MSQATGKAEPSHSDGVILKGTRRGLRIVLDETSSLEELVAALRRKLWPARRFFAGATATLEAGQRQATWAEWSLLLRTLRECGLRVADSPTEPDAQPEDGPESLRRSWRETDGGVRAVVGSARLTAELARAIGALASRVRGGPAVPPDRTLLVRRTLRSGQRIAYDGHVVVVGDVNPGAEVVASGDIVVMGSLRGVAHAGARGEESAVVVALQLQPLQLRIAHRVARAPDEPLAERGPEIARVRDGVVEVEPLAGILEEGTSAWRGASS
ncbi:MAG TPA: septum site-determining protein MinC [Limnochordales bacterium]